MGPQPFGCGRPVAGSVCGASQSASMGPQPFGCGRCRATGGFQSRSPLQWGRNLSVAEGPRAGPFRTRRRGFNGAATFRLRKVRAHATEGHATRALQWGRNLSVAEGRWWAGEGGRRRRASMGPQPFGCGRRVPTPATVMRTALQWGRNLSVAEGSSLAPGALQICALQWGRNLSVAEGRGGAVRKVAAASMGPQPFGCGRR